MVNRINKTPDGELDNLTAQDAAAAINYISESLSSRIPRPKDNLRFDALVLSLSNALENKRARQVTEWERIRQRNFQVSV